MDLDGGTSGENGPGSTGPAGLGAGVTCSVWGAQSPASWGPRWGQHWGRARLSSCSDHGHAAPLVRPPVSHGGGLAGPVVAQEGGDLPLVEVQAQPVDGHTAAVAVNLHQVADGDAGLELGRWLLHQHWKPQEGHVPGRTPRQGQDPLSRGAGPPAMGQDTPLGGQSPGGRARAQFCGCRPSAVQLWGGQGQGLTLGCSKGAGGVRGVPG